MIDVSGIEWNWGASVGWWLITVGILVVVGILAWLLLNDSYLGESIATGFISGAFVWFLVIGLIAMLVIPESEVAAQEEQIATEQLNEQGFEHVEMQRLEGFTASKDGEYFQGLLHSVGDHKYQIVEVPLN